MKGFASKSLSETREFAREWLVRTSNEYAGSENYGKEAFIVGLSGHLGAGKTAFVKCLAKELKVDEEVTSPTFVIMKLYAIRNRDFKGIWRRLVHIDAYRLERSEELDALNFEEIINDPKNLVMIEWPENVNLGEYYPRSRLIKFEIRAGEYCIVVEA